MSVKKIPGSNSIRYNRLLKFYEWIWVIHSDYRSNRNSYRRFARLLSTMNLKKCPILPSLVALFIASNGIVNAQTQQPSVPERVAAIKTELATSKAVLKDYEWIETTVVSLKGEEKSRKQQRCYYGAEGGIQKVEVSETPEPESKRGLRGRIAENKKEELTDYMKSAINLVKTYMPPDPAKIQAAKDAGKVTIEVLEPGKRIRLNFADYEKAGDKLGLEVDLEKDRLQGISVSTYVDDPKEHVLLDAQMGHLTDGTSYVSGVSLFASAKNINVTVQNTGYRKAN